MCSERECTKQNAKKWDGWWVFIYSKILGISGCISYCLHSASPHGLHLYCHPWQKRGKWHPDLAILCKPLHTLALDLALWDVFQLRKHLYTQTYLFLATSVIRGSQLWVYWACWKEEAGVSWVDSICGLWGAGICNRPPVQPTGLPHEMLAAAPSRTWWRGWASNVSQFWGAFI